MPVHLANGGQINIKIQKCTVERCMTSEHYTHVHLISVNYFW